MLPSSPRRINKSRGFGSDGRRSGLQKTGASRWKWPIARSEREGPRLANRSAQWVRPGIRGGFSFPNDSCPFAPALHPHPQRQRELPGGGSPVASSREERTVGVIQPAGFFSLPLYALGRDVLQTQASLPAGLPSRPCSEGVGPLVLSPQLM